MTQVNFSNSVAPPTAPSHLVEVKGLTKQFGEQRAVDNVSFYIPQGAIFGFIGPSGCGKTTTVRLLTGTYLPTGGDAWVFERRPADFTRLDRERIGYMPQHFVLYPDLTVWENLNFAASIYGGILAMLISLTVVFGLGVPMLGQWGNYILILVVLLFTSLGIGFLISLVSTTDTQAVQFAMFMLLGSVFFSGFILDLRYLWGPVRVVSWAMPATYVMRLLQDVMLRGLSLEPILFWGLLAIGVLMLTVSWVLMHMQMRPS